MYSFLYKDTVVIYKQNLSFKVAKSGKPDPIKGDMLSDFTVL